MRALLATLLGLICVFSIPASQAATFEQVKVAQGCAFICIACYHSGEMCFEVQSQLLDCPLDYIFNFFFGYSNCLESANCMIPGGWVRSRIRTYVLCKLLDALIFAVTQMMHFYESNISVICVSFLALGHSRSRRNHVVT